MVKERTLSLGLSKVKSAWTIDEEGKYVPQMLGIDKEKWRLDKMKEAFENPEAHLEAKIAAYGSLEKDATTEYIKKYVDYKGKGFPPAVAHKMALMQAQALVAAKEMEIEMQYPESFRKIADKELPELGRDIRKLKRVGKYVDNKKGKSSDIKAQLGIAEKSGLGSTSTE